MPDELRISIEKLVYGGDGLAHADGNTVFVPYVLPGEQVRAAVRTRKKKLIHTSLVKVEQVAAARIAAGVGKLDERDAERISQVTRDVGPLPKLNVRGTSIARRLHSDKKTRNGKVHFVLPTEIGKVEVVNDVPEEVVRAAVEEIRELSRGKS